LERTILLVRLHRGGGKSLDKGVVLGQSLRRIERMNRYCHICGVFGTSRPSRHLEADNVAGLVVMDPDTRTAPPTDDLARGACPRRPLDGEGIRGEVDIDFHG